MQVEISIWLLSELAALRRNNIFQKHFEGLWRNLYLFHLDFQRRATETKISIVQQ